MPLTADEHAELQGLLAHFGQLQQAAPEPDRPGFMSRLGQGFANTPSNIASGLANAGINMANYGQPPEMRFNNVNVPRPYDVPPAQDWSESAADLIPGLAAAIGTAMIPGGAVAKGAQMVGAGGTAAILGDVAAGAVLGASQGDAAGTATEFGLLGAANRFLPNPYLKALANAAIPVGGQLLRGQDPTSAQSLQSTGANIVVPWLLGQYARKANGARLLADQSRPPVATPEELAILQSSPQGQPLLSPEASPRGATAPPERVLPNGRWIPQEPQSWVPEAPQTGEGALSREQQLLQRYRPADVTAGPLPQEFPQDYPLLRRQEPIPEVPLPRDVSPGQDTSSAIREPIIDVQPPVAEPSGGMVRSPKFFEFAGANPTLLQYLGAASAGAVAQPLLDDDPNKPLWQKAGEGALRGLGTVFAGKRLLSGIASSPLLHGEPLGIMPGAKRLISKAKEFEGYTPALKLNDGSILVARGGEGHHELRSRTPDGSGLGASGFIDKSTGQFMNILEVARVREGAASEVRTAPNAVAIGNAYRRLAAKTGYPDVRIADLQAESGAPLSEIQSFLKDQWQAGKAHLSGGEPSYYTPEQRAAHVEINGDKMFLARLPGETPTEGTTLGAVAPSIFTKGRELLRSKAAEQERDPETFLAAPGKYVARGLERQGLLGKDPNIKLAQEQGKGTQLLSRDTALPPAQLLKRAQATDPAGVAAAQSFFSTKRTPSDVALLRSTASPEVAKAAETLSAENRKLQLLQAEASPEKAKLYEGSQGWQPRVFASFENPRQWAKDLKANPNLKTDAVDEMVKNQVLPGFDRWEVAQALDTAVAGIKRGKPFEGNANAAKISSHLTEHLKGITPPEASFLDTLSRNPSLSAAEASGVRDILSSEYVAPADADLLKSLASKVPKDDRPALTALANKTTLSPAYRALLGEYKDPVQREVFAAQKLIASAAQAKTIVSLSKMGEEGKLPIFDDAARRAEMNAAIAAKDTARQDELANYVRIPDSPAFGKLANKFTSREVSDTLNAQGDVWQGGYLRGASGATSWMKAALTVDNPATHARQIIQTPLMALIARVHPGDYWKTVRELKTNPQILDELKRNHIVGADVSSQDLQRGAVEMDTMFNPDRLDRAWQKVKNAQKFLQKLYGAPDAAVRIAAYIKRKPRLYAEGNAKGLKGDELNAYAEAETTKWVNEHTMNYGQVGNIVKVLRETPFVSPFISYQAEMLRLLGVLGKEAIHGSAEDRVWALGNIGGLIAAPLLLASAMRGRLSQQDQKEWDRVQRLSPEYAASQIRMPLGRNKDGSFRYLNIGNLVPAGDAAALGRNLANGEVTKVLATNPFIGWEKTPIFNTVSEQVTGRDTVTDQKLGAAGRVGSLAKSFLPPLIPPGYEGKRLLSSFAPNADGGLGLTNSRTGRVDSPGNFLLRQAGIPLANVQPAQLLQRAKSDFAEEKRAATSELRLVTQANATPAARGAALLRYNDKVKTAQKRLLESLK